MTRRLRTTSGPSDHVVVVGAGLGGLSAALHLAGAGRRVTVLEREAVPGGRAGRLELQGYAFDTGPTVLTMPGLVASTLAAVGEQLGDWLDLLPVEPAYRAWFPDGTAIDVHTDVDAMADEVALTCGGADAEGYRALVAWLRRLYRLEMAGFVDRNLDSPLDLLTPDLARLAAVGGFRRLAPTIRRFVRDPRLQRVFSFQSMYAGLSPYDALALYAVIAYMDTVAGVSVPRGGMHALPVALAGAATKHGVEIRYGVTVTGVERSGDRVTAVLTASGERITCDALVLNPDLPVARRELLGDPLRRPLRSSPSCFLLLAGSRATYTGTRHHTIHFGRAWRGVFDDLASGRLMSEPSVFVSNPTRTDPELAPPGREIYYVLAPTPNLDHRDPIDWRDQGPRYRDAIVHLLEERGYVGFGDAIEVEATRTPLDWLELGLEHGTPFAAAHTFGQTGPFRPANHWGDNVVLAGSGTVPGVGVPMVLVSGRLAAQRVTGR